MTSLKECAEILGLSVWTMRAWVQNGKIATHKIGSRRLIARSEINRIIEESRVPARAGNKEAQDKNQSLATTVRS
jgi:excisionase family DNA binding protein